MEKMKMHTRNLVGEHIERIAELFPNAITESMEDGTLHKVIDFEVLHQELFGEIVEGNQERYQFTWPDKKKSVILANAPIAKTLRLDRKKSVGRDGTLGSIDSDNIYIEGDNLDALKLLQETYLRKVKMIYIDPPYNTGNDFVYNDSFKQDNDEYADNSGQIDGEGNQLVQNVESNGRFHTDWLNMMYPRLRLAKDLLTDDGMIFISIDDNEVENLTKICNEIFGTINHCGTFVINSTPNARDYGHIGKMHEYCLFYAKNLEKTVTNMLPDTGKTFKYKDDKGGFNIHPLYNSNESFHKGNRPNLYYPFYVYINQPIDEKNGFYKIGLEKKEGSVEVYPPKSLKNQVQFVWRWGKEKSLRFMNKEIIAYEVNHGEYRIVQKMRHSEKIIRSLLTDTRYSSRRGTAEVEEILGGKIFSFPKPLSLLYDFCRVGTSENDIVLDFFSGSATTAHALMQINSEDFGNRKFIMVQIPEQTDQNSEAYKAGYLNICDVGEERIRRAGKKIKESSTLNTQNLDIGFRVFKVDSTNMKDVYYHPSKYGQMNLDSFMDNIKDDRTPEDLLIQVMLDLGVLLSSKIEETIIAGRKVFSVADGYLIACFDKGVTADTVTTIAQKHPYYAVFRDNGMANDSVATNFEQIFETYSPNTIRKVL